mgnify:CR=1 FL=1
MNKLLITLFATMFLVACGTEEADADDNWNTSEHNYNITATSGVLRLEQSATMITITLKVV